jgi:DNA transformation protein
MKSELDPIKPDVNVVMDNPWNKMNPISSIHNLGPATEAAFAKAGVHSAEQLRALGADAAYVRLLDAGTQPHFIGYYVLHMGLQGRPWNDCKGEEKQALRLKFDAIKANYFGSTQKGRSDLEAALNFFGVLEKR